MTLDLMKIPRRLACLAFTFGASTFILGSTLHGAITLPYVEDFSNGSEEFNSNPVSGSLNFNNFTYSVDGTGGVALFDVDPFLGLSSLSNFSGLGVIGDWQWMGDTTHNVHSFTVASSDSSAFALTSLDWAVGNGGPPTVFTLTGFRGLSQVAQVVNIDVMLEGTYGSTGDEIVASNIGPSDGSGYALNLVFSGVNWGNIDRIVFSATGNDALVALDNIEFSPAVIPEPTTTALLIGAGVLALGAHRRTRNKTRLCPRTH